jgi:hypothetical protein
MLPYQVTLAFKHSFHWVELASFKFRWVRVGDLMVRKIRSLEPLEILDFVAWLLVPHVHMPFA